MFTACNIATEMKSIAGICQRICQDFKTRKQEILNGNFTIAFQYNLSKKDITQSAITFSKVTLETLEQSVKYVQS